MSLQQLRDQGDTSPWNWRLVVLVLNSSYGSRRRRLEEGGDPKGREMAKGRVFCEGPCSEHVVVIDPGSGLTAPQTTDVRSISTSPVQVNEAKAKFHVSGCLTGRTKGHRGHLPLQHESCRPLKVDTQLGVISRAAHRAYRGRSGPSTSGRPTGAHWCGRGSRVLLSPADGVWKELRVPTPLHCSRA